LEASTVCLQSLIFGVLKDEIQPSKGSYLSDQVTTCTVGDDWWRRHRPDHGPPHLSKVGFMLAGLRPFDAAFNEPQKTSVSGLSAVGRVAEVT